MDIGIGFTETLLIVVMVLVFFGSKRLPSMMREMGRITAIVRTKANEFMTEINRASAEIAKPATDPVREQKAELRKKYLALRKNQTPEEIRGKSGLILERAMRTGHWKKAQSVFVYASLPEEVRTDELIEQALAQGKRVAIPLLSETDGRMEAAEIKGLSELAPGPFGIRKPASETVRRFYKSDIELVICPGVAFDGQGGRLGFGKAYYDQFLRDLRGRIPIIGLAFDFQILPEPLPFSYSDIAMGEVITETRVIGPAQG